MKRLKLLIRKKIKSNDGFSLAELLLSTIILLFATSILTSTITLAVRTYDKNILGNEANALCKTLSLVLRDRLTNIIRYEEYNNKNLYYSTSAGEEFVPFQILIAPVEREGENINPDSSDSAIAGKYGEIFFLYEKTVDGSTTKHPYRLVNSKAYKSGIEQLVAECIITPVFASSNEEVESFNVELGIYRNNSGGDKQLLSESKFVVYPINGNVSYIDRTNLNS